MSLTCLLGGHFDGVGTPTGHIPGIGLYAHLVPGEWTQVSDVGPELIRVSDLDDAALPVHKWVKVNYGSVVYDVTFYGGQAGANLKIARNKPF